MKKFLAVFIGSENSPNFVKWNAMDAEARKAQENAGMKAWMNWSIENAKVIAVQGSPVGKTKQVGPSGISDIKNKITAFTVVEAESHEAAAKLFVNHPHFMIFPGDSVEVMECLPIPTR